MVALACVPMLALPAATSATALEKPHVQRISALYVLNASSGTLAPVRGTKRVFTLRLKRLERHVVWFSDRPVRDSGTFPSSGLAGAWKGLGFASDPPNAALVYPARGGDGSTVIVKLTRPRYNARAHALSFTARWLDPTKVTDPNLRRHAKSPDPTPDRAFRTPSLFIDDTSASVVNGCVIRPYTSCVGANLYGANLSGANLTDANFAGAALVNANLTNANLGNINLTNAILTNANLTNANLFSASLFNASLTNTNLTDANLTDADLSGADLSGADLTGADIVGASLTGATFCQTTMPDGSTNNGDC